MLTPVLREVRAAIDSSSPAIDDALAGKGHVVHLASRWRGRAVYLIFSSRGQQPAVVLKIDAFASYQPRLDEEFSRLRIINQRPALVGSVPVPLALIDVGDRRVLAQSGVGGTPLSVGQHRRLRHGRRAALHDHELVSRWLRRFAVPAGPARRFDSAELQEAVARALPADSGRWQSFIDRLGSAAHEFTGMSIPQTWCHGDLGPSNCLRSGRDLRVIDWEGQVAIASPLVDVVTFLNHYARATPKRGEAGLDPQEAFERAFMGDGWLAGTVRRTFESELKAHGLPVSAAQLLLLGTLADMANGTAPTVHARRRSYRVAYRRAIESYAIHVDKHLAGPP